MMVQNIQLKVKYILTKSCFTYLSHQLTNKLSSTVQAIKVTSVDNQNKVYYFPFSNSPSFEDSKSIGISSTFAQLLNLSEGNYVNIIFVGNLPILSSINVIPRSKEDLEIIELRSTKMQEIILQQINVVFLKQPIVIWLSKNLNVVLYVDDLSPEHKYGKLENFTEVHVQDIVKNIRKTQRLQNDDDFDGVNIKYSSTIVRINPLPPVIEEVIFEDKFSTTKIHCDLNIFIHLSTAIKLFSDVKACEYFFCKVKKIQNNNEKKSPLTNEHENFNKKELIVKVIVIENSRELNKLHNKKLETIIDNNVFGCRNLLKLLNLKLGNKVFLKKTLVQKQDITQIELTSVNNEIDQKDFDSYIKKFNAYDYILINSNSKIYLASEVCCGVKFLPESVDYGFFTIEEVKKLSLTIFPKILDNSSTYVNQINIKPQPIVTDAIQIIINNCKKICELKLKTMQSSEVTYNTGNILICGSTGTGKTTLCELIKQQTEQSPYLFHVETINCKKLKGKKVEIVNKLMMSIMFNCAYYQPSLLLIDNIDSITISDVNENEENTLDSINAARITDSIINIITNYQTFQSLSVIATCSSINRLGSQFKTLGGIKLFNFVYHIPNLEKKDQLKIIQTNWNYKQFDFEETIDWVIIGDKIEGFIAQDLINLVEKVSFVAWKKLVQNTKEKHTGKIENADVMKVIENYNPIALHGVPLFTDSGYNWDDIGGLENVKTCFIQFLQWPLSYNELFSNSPVKQQSGILLYGMPGTGKTMIAGAIAKECGLNFISIKGPELLSKYMGASEEAVRNIFNRAQKAKPCVLFFDEFDSLAPRRGHDSTGVTDRIVNQLLTQLDGIEGREGVAIVAASSRPDLLDPALLRPGRLDKALYCPLPHKDDRMKILEILCKKFHLNSKDFNLEFLAERTKGFTGADLHFIFNQSKLDAIDEDYGKSAKLKEISEVIITEHHLAKALESTRPSLTPSEVTRFNKIYEGFSRGDHFIEDILNNPRVTLA